MVGLAGDEKNDHLRKLEKAAENLQLFKVELLDYNSLHAAIAECNGVFHVASPVPADRVANPEVDIKPAVMGTLNVVRACNEEKVKRVVVVSSAAAIVMNPNWPKDQPMVESCWSDEEHCKNLENWYCLSKTAAEIEAFDYAKTVGLDVVSICPSITFGPMLQPRLNSSSSLLVKILNDGCERSLSFVQRVVDVRVVAEAVLLAYEMPEAEGRYLCSAFMVDTRELVDKLKFIYPNYSPPKKVTAADKVQELNCEKLRKLGWTTRPLEQTLAESVQNYLEKGILDPHL
ncbi:hypothetical protein C5167_038753 [Papaver somniferum]|uniref:NAD-dependent epimerase/dehydratase domain-containing protein n=1 Tax=Papaver somniferum TaxID=3469 RepID=A0A4Y7IEH2_PAPSO|nr:hypothetical protein C5167_038753 [Papaver somniferum]